MKKTTVNVMNFVRATEPRLEMDLFGALERQLACMDRLNIRSTLLLQYDALISEQYRNLIAKYAHMLDVGLWLEVVRPLAERAGVTYHGRAGRDWDHHANATFLLGYLPEERKRLIDAAFGEFRARFGRYPAVAASWIVDAYSLAYMADKYDIVASANCIEQMGIDGYTLWGGYPAGGYYPSRENALCPAQTAAMQIDVPVFRLCGADLTHYYGGTHIYSVEPACPDAGGDRKWTEWYFRQITEFPCLAQSYLQTGQENSFGWARFGQGFEMQCELLRALADAGTVSLETMSETGRRYREDFPATPASARSFLEDWSDEDKQSVWYMSAYYRANAVADAAGLRLRDLFRFDERFAERYLDRAEPSRACFYTNLEVLSGLSRKDGREAGVWLIPAGGAVPERVETFERGADTLEIRSSAGFTLTFRPGRLSIAGKGSDWKALFLFRDEPDLPDEPDDNEGIDRDATRRLLNPPAREAQARALVFTLARDGRIFRYRVRLERGVFRESEGVLCAMPDESGFVALALDEPGEYL